MNYAKDIRLAKQGVEMYKDFSVSLIVPAMNEAKTLDLVLEKVPAWVDEIIVIDGNSKDDTLDTAVRNSRVSKVYVQRSKGKGAALSLGFSLASCDLIAIIDADGSMDPQELARYLDHFPNADIVKGSRNPILDVGSEDLTLLRDFGNRILTNVCNLLFNQTWTDLAYGYAVVRKNSLEQLGLSSYDNMGSVLGHKAYGQGFEIEALIFCRAANWNFKVVEVHSQEHRRISGSSNLRAIRDGFRVLAAIAIEKCRSRPREIRIGKN